MADDAAAWHRRGIALFEQGERHAAIEALTRSVALDDRQADAHADLGVMAHRTGLLDLAETHFVRALALARDAPRLHYNFANLLRDIGRAAEAEAHYRQAITREPGFALAHSNLGNLLRSAKRWDEAAACYRAALAADPAFAPAHRNLADLDEAAGRIEAATAGYGRAIGLRNDAGTRIRDALASPVIAESVQQIDDYRGRMAEKLTALSETGLRLDDPVAEVGATPFHLAYHGRDDRPLMEALARLYRAACPSLSFTAPHCAGWLGGLEGGRIRIGFISAFFRDHTVARLNERLIARLPRDTFEVHVFSFAAADDEMARRIAQSADSFHPLRPDLASAREAIAAAELDILYFTDVGMEPFSYFLAFARLAPVQCVSWGHPVTTGIGTLDYFISSRLIEHDGAEAAYSERLVRLDALPASLPAPEPAKGQADGPVFLCPQSLFKLHPDFDPLIRRILAACPGAELALLAGDRPEWEELLAARWRRTMPEVIDRIRFVPRRDRAGFLDLLASARVVLDTPHFCGGLSSFEALVSGTPVVALPGAVARGRVTLGYYRRMGLSDLLAEDGDAYVELAVRLARDDAFHAEMRGRIRERAAALVDDPMPIEAHAAVFSKFVYDSA